MKPKQFHTFSVTIPYTEEYLPPRCRKPRLRKAQKTYSARIPIVNKEDAPVAFLLSDLHHRKEGTVKIRLHKGRLYMLETRLLAVRANGGDHFGFAHSGFFPVTAERFKPYVLDNKTFEEKKERIRNLCADRIVIDNLVWLRCGEPVYQIQTFGLGNNHGSTGLFVETYIDKDDLRGSRYFNALQGDEAVAAFNAVAKGRGDTNSVGLYGKMIEVLLPEAVTYKPWTEPDKNKTKPKKDKQPAKPMKPIYLIFTADAWHSHSSMELVAVATTKRQRDRLVRKYILEESAEKPAGLRDLASEAVQEIQRMDQTQCLSKLLDYELFVQTRTPNEIDY